MADRKPRSRTREARPLPGHRRLVIRGRLWQWRFGKSIRIVSPEGVSTHVALTDFTGMSWDDLERADWKGYTTPVTPRSIRDHIERRILGYTDAGGFPPGSPERGRFETPGDGWRPVRGPRGTWHWKDGPCDIEVMSPEGVVTTHRAYLATGMGVDEWMRAKMDDLAANGLTMRDFDISNRVSDFLMRPVAAIPSPTDAQVERLIADVVVGRTAEAA